MIELDHNGYTVRFRESDDVWTCSDLDLENESLAKLRLAINKVYADARRCSLDALQIEGGYHADEFYEIKIVLLDVDRKSVWAMISRRKAGSNLPPKRSKIRLERIAADNPENRAKLAEVSAIMASVKIAEERAREILKSIPRLTPADLGSLPNA